MFSGVATDFGRRAIRRAALGLAAAACLAGSAFAQSPVCRQLESELASLSQPVSRPGRVARAERAMLARVQGNINALGCNRGFVLFGPQPPAQCAGLKAQAGALQGRIADIEAPQQVASAGNPRRRMQLLAAIDSYGCRNRQTAAVPAPQPQQRSLLDVLFGRPVPQPQYATPPSGPLPPLVDGQPVDQKEDPTVKKYSGGGNLPICVRTCDGFFFPVNYEGTRAGGLHQEVCEASCPNAPTEVYWMPAGADLDRAANEEGINYSQLPNAFKYRQAYDPACTCKARDQTWAVALRQADAILGARRNDIMVTAETSDQMARPTPASDLLRGVKGKKQAKTVQQAIDPVHEDGADATLSTSSTPPAPASPRSARPRAAVQDEAEKRDMSGEGGERRAVRIVNPR